MKMNEDDCMEIVLLCHAALAQDSPEQPRFYLNQILNLAFGYLHPKNRPIVDEYLAEKKYLRPLQLVQPNEAESNKAATLILND